MSSQKNIDPLLIMRSVESASSGIACTSLCSKLIRSDSPASLILRMAASRISSEKSSAMTERSDWRAIAIASEAGPLPRSTQVPDVIPNLCTIFSAMTGYTGAKSVFAISSMLLAPSFPNFFFVSDIRIILFLLYSRSGMRIIDHLRLTFPPDKSYIV